MRLGVWLIGRVLTKPWVWFPALKRKKEWWRGRKKEKRKEAGKILTEQKLTSSCDEQGRGLELAMPAH